MSFQGPEVSSSSRPDSIPRWGRFLPLGKQRRKGVAPSEINVVLPGTGHNFAEIHPWVLAGARVFVFASELPPLAQADGSSWGPVTTIFDRAIGPADYLMMSRGHLQRGGQLRIVLLGGRPR